MSKEEAKKLYEGKFFYEIMQTGPEEYRVFGPFDNIFYASKTPEAITKNGSDIEFLQVIDGKPVASFTKDEIYVTTIPLVGKKSKLFEGVSNVTNENR
jgi:hypothetical protein